MADDGVTKEHDLFEASPSVTEAMVAQSNHGYTTWPATNTFRQNLAWTFQFLENNVSEQLWTKCLETYNKYTVPYGGGPLMFKIIMNKIQVDTEVAVEYLLRTVKNMSVATFEGEDISKVVSLLRGAHRRLKGYGDAKVPKYFAKQLCTIFQTCTVTEFSHMFQHCATTAEILNAEDPGVDHWPKPEALLSLAEVKYLELKQTDKWTGITMKGNQSVFVAGGGLNEKKKPLKCFNCDGEGHLADRCPRPKNEALMEKRRAEYAKNNPKNGKKGGKKGGKPKPFAPPKPDEKNHREIFGKPYHWNAKDKRWYEERKKVAKLAAAATNPPAAQTTTVATPSVPTPVPVGNSKLAIREVALSNTQQAINLALRGLTDQFLEN